MKLIIAGSRDFNNYEQLVGEVLSFISGYSDVTIISGTADGADSLGEKFASDYKCSLIRMPANWTKYGRSAGFIRNEEMAKIASHCICFWDSRSKGTRNMILTANKYKLITKVVRY